MVETSLGPRVCPRFPGRASASTYWWHEHWRVGGIASPSLRPLSNHSRIIAIMLGRLGMKVDQCIRAYRRMAEKAFIPSTFLKCHFRKQRIPKEWQRAGSTLAGVVIEARMRHCYCTFVWRRLNLTLPKLKLQFKATIICNKPIY